MAPVVTALVGDYQVAWLELEGGWKEKEPVNVPLFVSLRAGQVTATWFCHPATSGGMNL
jgi:hypothetical protein